MTAENINVYKKDYKFLGGGEIVVLSLQRFIKTSCKDL